MTRVGVGMEFQDRVLTCVACGEEFTFSAGAQQFFAEKGFEHDPKRCRDCKSKRRETLAGRMRRDEYSVSCAQCGRDTTVPFKPAEGRPVFCRSCVERRRMTAV